MAMDLTPIPTGNDVVNNFTTNVQFRPAVGARWRRLRGDVD